MDKLLLSWKGSSVKTDVHDDPCWNIFLWITFLRQKIFSFEETNIRVKITYKILIVLPFWDLPPDANAKMKWNKIDNEHSILLYFFTLQIFQNTVVEIKIWMKK